MTPEELNEYERIAGDTLTSDHRELIAALREAWAEVAKFKQNNRYHRGYHHGEQSMRAGYTRLLEERAAWESESDQLHIKLAAAEKVVEAARGVRKPCAGGAWEHCCSTSAQDGYRELAVALADYDAQAKGEEA